jgi:replicative DNA helicase
MIYDLQMEKAALGLINPAKGEFAEKSMLMQLDENDFYDANLRKLFVLFRDLFNERKELNVMDVQDSFEKVFDQKPYVWLEWLNEYPFLGAPYQIVENLKKLRARREAKNFKVTGDDEELYPSQFSQKSRELTAMIMPHKIGQEEIISRIENGVKTIKTGFKKFDYLTGGIEQDSVYVLSAQPGTGKTAIAINIAKNIISNGNSVYFVSLEMSEERILTRLMQCFWKETSENVRKNIRAMQKLPGTISIDRSGSDINKILSGMMMNLDNDIFIIDYFTLIQMNGKQGKVEKLEDICHLIKNFAYEHKKPVMLIAQPKRGDSKTNSEPSLTDLAWCAALEQDASIVAFLWDKNAKTEDTNASKTARSLSGLSEDEREKDLKLIIRKCRNGRCGTIDMEFDGDKMLFSEKTI